MIETMVKNYKEPLLPIPQGGGYGYYGAVTVTKDGEGVQCHVCGKFFKHLSGHVRQHHKINVRDYKEKFNLTYSTPLSSDNYRETMKLRTLAFFKNMTPEEKAIYWKRRSGFRYQNQGGHTGYRLRLETKNKRGTCPDQLIEQIRQCQVALGHTPTKAEFISWSKTQRYVHKIYDTFGSWKKAIEIAGLIPSSTPVQKGKKPQYHNEELLEYLTVFYEETGKSPTATDWYSHDLPNYELYVKRFGSIRRARELAGVPDPDINRKGMKYITMPAQL